MELSPGPQDCSSVDKSHCADWKPHFSNFFNAYWHTKTDSTPSPLKWHTFLSLNKLEEKTHITPKAKKSSKHYSYKKKIWNFKSMYFGFMEVLSIERQKLLACNHNYLLYYTLLSTITHLFNRLRFP